MSIAAADMVTVRQDKAFSVFLCEALHDGSYRLQDSPHVDCYTEDWERARGA
jgi:hypothetical protein